MNNKTQDILSTIIIPIHKLEEGDIELLERAIASIKKQKDTNFKVAIIVPKDLEEKIKSVAILLDTNHEFTYLVNSDATDYASQVNAAIQSIETEYFSVLQYDDELLDNFTLNVNQSILADTKDVYIPIIFELDELNNFIGFSNESVWARNHMEEFGNFDLTNTKKHRFYNYNLCGATYNKNAYIESGGLKPSLKKYSDFELLLRMLSKGKSIYVIPKLMYKHVNGRKGSIFDTQKDMSENAMKFWYELAKKEYHFDYDRGIEFVNN